MPWSGSIAKKSLGTCFRTKLQLSHNRFVNLNPKHLECHYILYIYMVCIHSLLHSEPAPIDLSIINCGTSMANVFGQFLPVMMSRLFL